VGIMSALWKGQGLRMQVPFGPFLVIGALFYLFWGPQLEVRILPRFFGLG